MGFHSTAAERKRLLFGISESIMSCAHIQLFLCIFSLFFFFFFFTKELLFFCEFESAIVYIDETTTHVSSITAVVIWNVLFIF